MLKLIGAVLIMLASTVGGWLKASQFANRPRQIRELILALQRLATEISYGVTPLPDALSRTGDPLKEPLKTMFRQAAASMLPPSGKTAKESLHEAIDRAWRHTAMKAPERDTMVHLAYSLGTSDRTDQMRHIELAAQQLKHEEASALADQARYEKMSRSLGLLIGALIVILIY